MTISVVQYDEIKCDSLRGCSAFYQAGDLCYSDETRREARAEGWVCWVPNSRRYRPRLDFCPEHANEGLQRLGRPLREEQA